MTKLRDAESLLAEVEDDSLRAEAIAALDRDDSPEYPLGETIERITRWMLSPKPEPPEDMIELFQSARWWLRRRQSLSPVTDFLKKAPGVNGSHAVALDAERISVALMSERGVASEGEGPTVEEAEATALNKLAAEIGT